MFTNGPNIQFLKFPCMWQVIFFAGTKLSSVHSGALCGLENLEEINLSKNKLTTPPELLPVKRTLRTLFLAENKIGNFPHAYFDGFEILRHVNIANNELYFVPNVGDIGHSLEVFAVNNNRVKSLDVMTGGKDMNKLRMLNARNNTIDLLNTSSLTLMANLRVLDLSYNQLRSLADPTPYISPSNSESYLLLLLKFNPSVCDEKLDWVPEFKKEAVVRVHNGQCHQPACLKDRFIRNLSKYLTRIEVIRTFR